MMRMIGLFLACVGLGVGVFPERAWAQDQAPPSIKYGAHDPSLLQWHRLPPIRIRSARLVRDDGLSSTWDVIDRQGNFTVIRTQQSGGAVNFLSFTGPQQLNHAWVSRAGLGERVSLAVEGVSPAPPLKALQVLDGVAAETLSQEVVLRQDGTGGAASVTMRREVRDAQWTSVEVNGAPYLLKSFVVHVRRSQNGAVTQAGAMVYVPVLGIGVEGAFEAPNPIQWRFEAIRVDPDVLSAVQQAALK